MKSLFDMVAIFSGIIGMGSIAYNASALTPENAAVHSARAIIVLVFVIVPFIVARALEKTEIKALSIPMLPARQRQTATQNPASTPTTYFDYLFHVDSAREWDAASAVGIIHRKANGNNQSR